MTETPHQTEPQAAGLRGGQEPSGRRRRPSRRLPQSWYGLHRRAILLGAGVVAAAAAVTLAIDLYVQYVPALRAMSDARDRLEQAESLLRADAADLDHVDAARLAQVQALLNQAADDLGPRSDIINTGFLARFGAHVPVLDGQILALRALRSTAYSAVILGNDLLPLVNDVIVRPAGDTTPTVTRLAAVARRDASRLELVSRDIDQLRTATQTLPGGRLLGPLDSVRTRLQRDVPQIEDNVAPAISLLAEFPVAIGPGQHTYVIALSNSGEERPGGGFIGAVGMVVFRDGALVTSDFRGSEFANTLVHNLRAPRPLDSYMFRGHPWELSDSNWSPDFPTSAAQIVKFFQLATGMHADGVVEVDPVAFGYVLAQLGPVQVPPYPQVVTADNALVELNKIINKARPQDPGKVYLAPFGHEVLDRVVHTPLARAAQVAAALQRGAREKHIVVNFDNLQLQATAVANGFDGALPAPLSDSLLVNDANVSGTKGDLFVRRSFSLTAKVYPDGEVFDHLVLTYENPVVSDPVLASLVRDAAGYYRDYLRVYVPETARVDGMTLTVGGQTRAVSPEEVTYEGQREAIGYFLVVPSGATAVLTIDYGGPFADIASGPERYALAWEKQLNALTWQADLTVVMPTGARRHWSAPLDQDIDWAASL